jgi:hypothetical protein
MRPGRIATALVPAMVVLSALAASAHGAPTGRRVEQGEYAAAGVYGAVGLSAAGQENLGGVRFAAGPERFVSVTVTDKTGQPVLAEVTQDYNADNGPDLVHVICGSTQGPVRIKPDYEMRVYVYAGTCEDGSTSVPTTGTVTATFTRKK